MLMVTRQRQIEIILLIECQMKVKFEPQHNLQTLY